jgi:neutral ceramidase
MKTSFSDVFRAVMGSGLLFFSLHADALDVQVGVATVDLTPPMEMKASLGGYGSRMNRPATGVHDAVLGKALVLVGEERKFALVTADILAFPPGFKAAVMERLGTNGWREDQIMLLASHSHTSIDMMALHPKNTFGIPQVGLFHKELLERTARLLAQAIREAEQKQIPIFAASLSKSVPGRNRNRRQGGAVHDETLTVTRLDTADHRPLAVLVNWTAHPTFMDAEDMLFSGDWPGQLQRTLEALIGPGATVLFYNGAEGDQSPVSPECSSHWERAERYGREMGIAAWRLWEKIEPRPVRSFSYHSEPIVLPPRQPHPDFMKTGGAEYGLNEANMKVFLEQLVPAQTHSTCLRLGDLVIVGVPGEMAAQLGLNAKATIAQTTGATCVTIGGLADEWISYILPPDEYRLGGYEASMSFYGEELAKAISAGLIRAARGVQ